MIEVPLTKGYVAFVDDADAWVLRYKWYANLGGGEGVYAARWGFRNGRSGNIKMHREMMNAQSGVLVDHIDGNGLNNQRSNLRYASPAQNRHNSKVNKNSRTGYKGVHRRRGKHRKKEVWWAYTTSNGKKISFGYHDSPEKAAHAYNEGIKLFHGEFAKLNNIGGH